MNTNTNSLTNSNNNDDNSSDGNNSNSNNNDTKLIQSPMQANRQTQAGLEKKSLSDFMMGNLLGEGAYARVHVCKLKDAKKLYAIKVMEKRFIIKEDKIEFVNMERKVLSTFANHPLLVHLYFSFHDSRFLYLVLDLCPGGDLHGLINFHVNQNEEKNIRNRACPVDDAKFYITETLMAIQHLHANGFVHRDIKPENILLAANGHIKLSDFGTVKDENVHGEDKINSTSLKRQISSSSSCRSRRDTFCGTADYVSPEVLGETSVSVGADLWAFGCLIFHILIGRSAFRAESEYLVFQLIMTHDAESSPIKLPPRVNDQGESTPDDEHSTKELEKAIDLINKLLIVDPCKRLGASNNFTPRHPMYVADSGNEPKRLREHVYFANMDVANIYKCDPPTLPYSHDIMEPTYDGATDEWLLASDITELEMASAMEAVELENTKPRGPVKQEFENELSQFLEDSEKILADGVVVKRRMWFHTNTRHLMLTSYPRFIYIDPVTFTLKGTIPVTAATHLDFRNARAFDIVTPNRNYHITDIESDPKRWETALEEAKKYLTVNK